MSKPLSPSPLCRIAELPDLMIDGCVCDERNTLVFASLWGRDTAIQEFVARLTLRSDEKGTLIAVSGDAADARRDRLLGAGVHGA